MIRHRYEGRGFKDRIGKPPAYAPEFLVAQYRAMVRLRLIEREIARRYHEDQMKTPVHLAIGQEATGIGSCAALRREDQVWMGHRTHGFYLGKGGDLRAMMSELYCRANGCAGSRGGSMHLIDHAVGVAGSSAIVGGIVPIATGAALAAQLRKKDQVQMVFVGDATTEEGVFSESINFATLKKLPIVYFCENNFYSVQSPLGPRQPEVEIWKRAAGFGMKSVLIDGTNVLDVYEASRDAVESARAGHGPVFIEARCYRYLAHAGAGDDSGSGYRDVEEREAWERDADPIGTYESYLRSCKLLDDAAIARMNQEITAELLAAFAYAIASPDPVEADLHRGVYA